MTTLETFLQDDASRALYAEEKFVIDATEELAQKLEEAGCSYEELAQRMGVTVAEVTALFEGEELTLRQLAKATHALGGVPRFSISPP